MIIVDNIVSRITNLLTDGDKGKELRSHCVSELVRLFGTSVDSLTMSEINTLRNDFNTTIVTGGGLDVRTWDDAVVLKDLLCSLSETVLGSDVTSYLDDRSESNYDLDALDICIKIFLRCAYLSHEVINKGFETTEINDTLTQ